MARRKRGLRPSGRRSGFEDRVAASLKAAGIDYEYETKTIEYIQPAKKRKYVPDFILPNGVIVEAKGLFDREAREKMLNVVSQHPELDIRILFMRDNPITKGSRNRYETWCEKRGLVCATSLNGTVPAEWLVPNPERPAQRDSNSERPKPKPVKRTKAAPRVAAKKAKRGKGKA
jgi:hypothetical protein